MLRLLIRIIFWGSILFLAFFLWTVTLGQTINYEFRDNKLADEFYSLMLGGTPLVILLTLFGTFKKRHSATTKLLSILVTVGAAALTFMFLVSNLFTLGFGTWTTFNIAYEHERNPERQVREQRYDAGALGYGGNRIVEVRPFAGFFWKILPVDTTKLDKTEWRRIDQESDIRFP